MKNIESKPMHLWCAFIDIKGTAYAAYDTCAMLKSGAKRNYLGMFKPEIRDAAMRHAH